MFPYICIYIRIYYPCSKLDCFRTSTNNDSFHGMPNFGTNCKKFAYSGMIWTNSLQGLSHRHIYTVVDIGHKYVFVLRSNSCRAFVTGTDPNLFPVKDCQIANTPQIIWRWVSAAIITTRYIRSG